MKKYPCINVLLKNQTAVNSGYCNESVDDIPNKLIKKNNDNNNDKSRINGDT